MKHLFIIFSKRDLRKALNVSESSKNTAYFLWHADIGASDMELLRSRGSVYQESDFVSTKERYVVEKECYQFLKSLDDQAKKSLAYKTISIPQIVWRDTRLFVNAYLFLRRIVPQLIDVFRPECIHIPKARKFDNRLIRSICEEHSRACLSDYGNRAYMTFAKETGSVIHWASDAANIIKWLIRSRFAGAVSKTLNHASRTILWANMQRGPFDQVFKECEVARTTCFQMGKKKKDYLKNPDGYIFSDVFNAKYILKGILYHPKIKKFWKNWREENQSFKEKYFYILEEKITNIIKKRKLEIVVTVESIEYIYRTYDIRLVVVWNDALWWERLIVMCAQRMKVGTFHYQHGLLSDRADEFLTIIPEKIGVWGPKAREHVCKYGISRDRIVIVGNPELQKHYEVQGANLHVTKTNAATHKGLFISLPEPHHRLYYAPLPFEEARRMLECVLGASKELEIDLSIKTKGKKDKLLYQFWVNHFDAKCRVLIECAHTIEEMILASDFIVTYESTAVLEAMILQKPVIVIDLYDDMRENFFISQGAVLLAHDVDSLKDCMRRLNSNQDNIVSQLNDRSREFLRDYASIGVLENPPKFSEELLKSIQ